MEECEKYSGMLDAYADDELSQNDLKAVERHLAECVKCTQSLETLRKTDNIIRLCNIQHASPEEWSECWKAIEARINSGFANITGADQNTFEDQETRQTIRLSTYWKTLTGLATAAAILIAVGLYSLSVQKENLSQSQLRNSPSQTSQIPARWGFFDSLRTNSPDHTIIFLPPTENDVAVIWLINDSNVEEETARDDI